MPTTLQNSLKWFYLTCIFLLNIGLNNAQNISVLTGLSFPVGLYGSKDVAIKDAGFANKGYCTSIKFEDNRKNKLISFYSQFTHNYNTIDELALEKFAQATSQSNINIQAINSWQQIFLGIGPKVNYNHNNYTLFAKTAIGLNWLFSAAYNQFDSTNFIKQKRLNANALGLSVGFGSSIKIIQNVNFTLNIDYFYSNANYGKVVITNQNGNVISIKDPQTLEVPLQAILVQCGLTFDLNKNSKNFIKK